MNLFIPAFNSFFRKKKLLIYIITISITFGLIISVIYDMYKLNNIYYYKIKNNIKNRVLSVTSSNGKILDTDINYISSLGGVNNAYLELNDFSINIEGGESFTVKYISNEEIVELLENNSMESKEELQVILPYRILNSNGEYEYFENLIDKNVNFFINDDITINAQVTGVYNPKNYETYVYVNEVFKSFLENYDLSSINDNYIKVVVRDYNDVDSIIDTLVDKGYNAYIMDKSGQTDIKIYNMAKSIILLMIAFITIFTYISITIIVNGIISGEKMDIAILKAIGYKEKQIYKIMKLRIVAIIIVSIILGVIISLGVIQLIASFIFYKLNILININLVEYILLLMMFSAIIYIITCISLKVNNIKIKRINIIELMKNI